MDYQQSGRDTSPLTIQLVGAAARFGAAEPIKWVSETRSLRFRTPSMDGAPYSEERHGPMLSILVEAKLRKMKVVGSGVNVPRVYTPPPMPSPMLPPCLP
jgi:hypothetical protein